MFVAMAIAVMMLVNGCRTEYYENGNIKSEGFCLGTAGGNDISLIKVQGKE